MIQIAAPRTSNINEKPMTNFATADKNYFHLRAINGLSDSMLARWASISRGNLPQQWRLSQKATSIYGAGPRASASKPIPDGAMPELGGWARFVAPVAGPSGNLVELL